MKIDSSINRAGSRPAPKQKLHCFLTRLPSKQFRLCNRAVVDPWNSLTPSNPSCPAAGVDGFGRLQWFAVGHSASAWPILILTITPDCFPVADNPLAPVIVWFRQDLQNATTQHFGPRWQPGTNPCPAMYSGNMKNTSCFCTQQQTPRDRDTGKARQGQRT